MNSSNYQEKDPLLEQLKKDADALLSQSTADHRQQTVELIRKDFQSNAAKVIPFPNLSPLLAVAAAIVLVAGLIFLQTQKNSTPSELAVSQDVMQKSLEDLAILKDIPDPAELTASFTSDPMLDELNAIAEELTATFQGIWELVEAS